MFRSHEAVVLGTCVEPVSVRRRLGALIFSLVSRSGANDCGNFVAGTKFADSGHHARISQPQFDEGLREGILHALLGPSAEAHIEGTPLAVAIVLVAPGTADPKHATCRLDIADRVRAGTSPHVWWATPPR